MSSLVVFFAGFVAIVSSWLGVLFHHQTPGEIQDAYTTTVAATTLPENKALAGKLRVLYKGKETPFFEDNVHVYLDQATITPAFFKESDAESFRIVAHLSLGPTSEWILKDKKQVYFFDESEGGIFDGADVSTFSMITPHTDGEEDEGALFKDKDHVFGIRGQMLPIDARSVMYLGNNFLKDDAGAYFIDGSVVPIPDLTTFSVLSHDYAKDDSVVYFRAATTTFDSATFSVLDQSYVKDKSRVYFSNKSDVAGNISMASATTFSLFVHDPKDSSFSGPDEYAKDAERVYFDMTVVPGADVATFVPLNDRYGKDANHVYVMDQVVPAASPADFSVLLGTVWFGKDSKHVFTGTKIIPDADPATFKLCDHTAETCRVLGGAEYNAYDKNHLYFYEKIIQ